MRIIIAILIVLPFWGTSQGYYLLSKPINNFAGVKFENQKKWEEIKQQARKQQKKILIDFYATWCGPCKEMDRTVYTSKTLGDFSNSRYVAVKMQIDSSSKDNEFLRAQYAFVKKLKDTFSINILPTFLILSSEGKALHRDEGFKNTEEFLQFLKEGDIDSLQLYTQLENYLQGKRDFSKMANLATKTYNILKKKDLGLEIAREYANNYLNRASEKVLLKKANILFISWWPKILNSENRYFQYFLDNPKKIDSVMEENKFSERITDYIIAKEEIWDKLVKGIKESEMPPNWTDAQYSILKKYNSELAKRIITNAKVKWHLTKREWTESIKYYIQSIEQFGYDTSIIGLMGVNNFIYSVILPN